MQLFTYTLTAGSISISAADGVTQLSISANDKSSCTVSGAFTFKGIPSNAVTLSNGQSLTITTPTYSPLDNVTIAWVSGSTDLLIGF